MNIYEELLALVKTDRASTALMLVVLLENGQFERGKHDFFISLAEQVKRKILNAQVVGGPLFFENTLSYRQFESVSRSAGGFFRRYSNIILEK